MPGLDADPDSNLTLASRWPVSRCYSRVASTTATGRRADVGARHKRPRAGSTRSIDASAQAFSASVERWMERRIAADAERRQRDEPDGECSEGAVCDDHRDREVLLGGRIYFVQSGMCAPATEPDDEHAYADRRNDRQQRECEPPQPVGRREDRQDPHHEANDREPGVGNQYGHREAGPTGMALAESAADEPGAQEHPAAASGPD